VVIHVSEPSTRVTNAEAMAVFNFLSTHPRALGRDPRHYALADAIFGFGRVDPAVAKAAVSLYQAGVAPLVMFTGGLGKDSGPVLKQYGVPEAAFQAALAVHAGVPFGQIIIEDQATHGGGNCRLGYQAVAHRLGRAPGGWWRSSTLLRCDDWWRYSSPLPVASSGRP
jgi:uncharacterized SAM-binding protein YcdF (DUF218 family)